MTKLIDKHDHLSTFLSSVSTTLQLLWSFHFAPDESERIVQRVAKGNLFPSAILQNQTKKNITTQWYFNQLNYPDIGQAMETDMLYEKIKIVSFVICFCTEMNTVVAMDGWKQRIITGTRILAEIKRMQSSDKDQTRKTDKHDKEHKATKITHTKKQK